MDNDQFAQFMQLFAASRNEATPRPASRVNWANLSELSTAEPENLDKWFLEFETRLRSMGIPEATWVEKFVECPSVPEHLKARVREEEETATPFTSDPSYAELRRKLLKEFGPTEPVAFYARRLHHLQCATASEAKEKLTTLLELHNRAAKDSERGTLQSKDLCYCFMDSLPTPLRQHLEANYPLASVSDQPLEKLFKMAKAKEAADGFPGSTFYASSTNLPRSPPAIPAEVVPGPRKRPRSNDSRIASALTLLAQRLGGADFGPRGQRGPARQGSCQSCGRSFCESRETCPARGRECYRCHQVGHFGSVCRSGPQTRMAPATAGSRPFRRVFNANPPR